jgi:YegS/Rv2252/BmrU family lipid kinase
MNSINNILVLVNPSAANSTSRDIWDPLIPRFEALFANCQREVVMTRDGEQSVELGASTEADLIIAIGGDGTAHSIAQGLTQRPRDERPALAVVPIGSGNDFARTLGMPTNPRRALELISEGQRTAIDLGCCNGTAFLETLSFGIDAAIALKTVEMRKNIKNRGTLLYARAAVSAIIHDLKPHHFTITTEDNKTVEKDLLICAVQNGPTYGGGFRIAPSARPDDGLLNMCMAVNTNRLHALYALTLVARGTHERLPIIETHTTRNLTISLEHEIPAQYDGELLTGSHFEIELLPKAIDVILPHGKVL